MDTNIVTDLGKQAPALLLMVAIVYFFLKYLESRDRAMKALFDEHLDARTQSRQVIRENTECLRQNAATRVHVTEALKQLKDVMKENKHDKRTNTNS